MTSWLLWDDAFGPDDRVLLIVNSWPSQLDEIARAFEAVAHRVGPDRMSVIAPGELRSWFLHHGVDGGAVLVPRVEGLLLEFGEFLERPLALQWALARRASRVLGTAPYAPRNEEVKADFERRIAPMLGDGRYVAHSLPAAAVFLLAAEQIWARASRPTLVRQHADRQRDAIGAIHDAWVRRGRPAEGTPLAAALEAFELPPLPEQDAVEDVRREAFRRLTEAVRLTSPDSRMPRLFVAPIGARPRGGWLPAEVEPVRRPLQRSSKIRQRGTRLVVRGQAEGPYSYLVMSRPKRLKKGDAVLASGRVYRGGLTIGLVRGDHWASRVDIDTPGAFLAAAVATESGEHSLVVANCLKGDERKVGAVLHRFGWTRGVH